MRYISILSWCALALLVDGCGPGTTTVSCEVGADADAGAMVTHVCTQYDNEPDNAVTDLDGACMGVPGSGCSPAGAVATCVLSDPDYVTTVTTYYYSFSDDAAMGAAHDACATPPTPMGGMPAFGTWNCLSGCPH
jgi:hypothetical protein